MTTQGGDGAAAKGAARAAAQGGGEMSEGGVQVLQGDCRLILPTLEAQSVHCCISSPPYFGLRSYNGGDAEIGQEATPAEFVAALVDVYRGVWRVLRDDGTAWLNLGDSYCSIGHKKSSSGYGTTGLAGGHAQIHTPLRRENNGPGLKHKDLMGIPWRVAFALQDDGWYLRSAITWCKPNPMPESVGDRPTNATEMVFLFSKQERYFYDSVAVAEPCVKGAAGSTFTKGKTGINGMGRNSQAERVDGDTRNLRNFWVIPTQPTQFAHFATFPEELVRRCLLAGTSDRGCCPACGAPWKRVVERGPLTGQGENPGQPAHLTPQGYLRAGKSRCGVNSYLTDAGWMPTCTCDAGDPVPCTVLDPFLGSGTVARVALRYRRRAIGIELNPAYVSDLVEQRTTGVQMTLEVG